MTHSYRVHYFHLIWSTKGRKPFIKLEIESRLYDYLGGITRSHKGSLLEIGGMPDHVHLLIKFSSIDKYSDFIRALKANSTLWIHKNFQQFKDFEWQEGYGSYSVSYSSLDAVQKYIQNQEEHHRVMTFDEEYQKFLKGCGVQYDERFVLG